VSDLKVQIKNLYKIFGANPKNMVQHVENGMGKPELLEKHGHVLGLNNINLDIPAKKVQVIMGLSGSGKSTLIRHINRLIEPTAGEMIVDGENVLTMNDDELRAFRRKKASMVFQKFALLPHRTVADNAAYGLTIQNIPEGEAKERSQKWIDRVGLSGFEQHYPAQLSGGMQQRVGLARALATDAEILLMDEAFSALDPLIKTDMQDVLLQLQQELNKTIVFITHDLDEALRIGDRIAILNHGEIAQQGTAQEIILKPADDYVTDFVKDINRARVLRVDSIMGAASDKEHPEVTPEMRLDEVTRILQAANANHANVVGPEGRCVGTVALDDIVGAMVEKVELEEEPRLRDTS